MNYGKNSKDIGGNVNYVVEKPKKMPDNVINHFAGKMPFQNQYVKDDPFEEMGGKNQDFVKFLIIFKKIR